MTQLIDDKKLAQMQQTQELNLPETAYIQELEKESDGQGGYIEVAWNTIATVKARIGDPKGETEKEAAGRIDVGKVSVITLPAGTQLAKENQIQVDGVNYRVHWTNEGKSNLTALRVVVTRAER